MAPDQRTSALATALGGAPRPLSVEESRLLSDPQLSGERSAPLSLAGRVVTNLTVSETDFTGSWEGASIEQTTFRRCGFSGHELGRATYRGTTFEDCAFEGCSFARATFQGCRFVDCTFRVGSISMVTFRDCCFIDSTLSRVAFQHARFDGVTLEGCSLAHVRFAECKLHFVALASAALDAVRFTRCEAGRLLLSDCVARQLMLLGGAWGIVEVERGQLSEFALAEATVSELRISDVERATRFGIGRSRVLSVSLEQCVFSGMSWRESELGRLTVVGGTYDGWLTQCSVGAGSAIGRAELASFFWDRTRIDGITFTQVSFTNFICARNAHFANMRLVDVSYSVGIRLVLEGALFENSERFCDSPEGAR